VREPGWIARHGKRRVPSDSASIFEFVINLKTAKALGIKIPPSVLIRADQVIE